MKGSNGRIDGMGGMSHQEWKEILAGMRRTIAEQAVLPGAGQAGSSYEFLGRLLMIAALVVGGLLMARPEATVVSQLSQVGGQHESR